MKKKPKRKKRPAVPERRLKVEYVSIKKLKLWEENPRHNDEAAERLAELLGAHGFIVPMIATRDGIIRAGNTRYKAAKRKGMKKVPVIYVDFDSEEEAKMFSLADNRSHEWAIWDQDTLDDLIQNLRSAVGPEEFHAKSGFHPMEIPELDEQPEEMPESLAQATRLFERQVRELGLEDEWLWFWVPDREAVEKLMAKYGVPSDGESGSGRELDWKKVRRKLK